MLRSAQQPLDGCSGALPVLCARPPQPHRSACGSTPGPLPSAPGVGKRVFKPASTVGAGRGVRGGLHSRGGMPCGMPRGRQATGTWPHAWPGQGVGVGDDDGVGVGVGDEWREDPAGGTADGGQAGRQAGRDQAGGREVQVGGQAGITCPTWPCLAYQYQCLSYSCHSASTAAGVHGRLWKMEREARA